MVGEEGAGGEREGEDIYWIFGFRGGGGVGREWEDASWDWDMVEGHGLRNGMKRDLK